MSKQTCTTYQPTISLYTLEPLWVNGLVQFVSNKPATNGCEEAIKHRIALPYWNGLAEHEGVPLECEIKTALFLAKQANGEEVYITVHVAADTKLASAGVIKEEVKSKTGLELIGKLDKDRALSGLNTQIAPLLEYIRGCDHGSIDGLKQELEKEGEGHDPLYIGDMRNMMEIIEKHAAAPQLKHGELNPWTLFMLTNWSYEPGWADYNVKPVRMVHIVSEELEQRAGCSTTNVGSRYVSMALGNTARAFEFLKVEHERNPEVGYYMSSGRVSSREPGRFEGLE